MADFYKALSEASDAVARLGISRVGDYYDRRKEDPRLPARPDQVFSDSWQGWDHFFGRPGLYGTVGEASVAAIKLGINSSLDYREKYSLDPSLPAVPTRTFRKSWVSWDSFLGRIFETAQERRGFYATLAEASQAAIRLEVTGCKEYEKNYSQDDKLPRFPWKTYIDDWTNWTDFLGEHSVQKTRSVFYKTYAEAASVVRGLDIKTAAGYGLAYKDDPLLPRRPMDQYKREWVSWDAFFGIKNRTKMEKFGFYSTLEEVKEAVAVLNICSSMEYHEKYRLDPSLPACPGKIYEGWTGWHFLFGKKKREIYETFYEASAAAISLGIEGSIEYAKRYKGDPKLPSSPHVKYIKDWRGWGNFLATDRKAREGDFGGVFYPNIEEAKKAAQALGITTSTRYSKEYRHDPLLPCSPYKVYWEDWDSWPEFLGTKDLTSAERHGFYQTLAEAKSAVAALGANTRIEYADLFARDPMLPSSPSTVYGSEWLGWPDFFDRDPFKTGRKYLTLAEATNAAKRLGVKKVSEYIDRYKEDPMLPVSPFDTYESEWVSWESYLGVNDLVHKGNREFYGSIGEASKAAIGLGIKTCNEYFARYKEDDLLPSRPETTYLNKWRSWKAFLRVQGKYYPTLAEAKAAVKKLGFNTQSEYHAGCKQDPMLPFAANDAYRLEWIDWPDFFGRDKSTGKRGAVSSQRRLPVA